MYEAVLIEVRQDPHKSGNIGSFRFAACPRIGEEIAIDDKEGVGQIYKVIAIHHEAQQEDPPTVIGDIFVVWVGEYNDAYLGLFDREASQAKR